MFAFHQWSEGRGANRVRVDRPRPSQHAPRIPTLVDQRDRRTHGERQGARRKFDTEKPCLRATSARLAPRATSSWKDQISAEVKLRRAMVSLDRDYDSLGSSEYVITA
jgi:hypothetical protein